MRILTLGLLLATGLAGAASAQTVGGTYSVSGTNADGSSYTGSAEITLNGSDCSISWQTGGSSSAGTCLLTGNAFGAAYQLGDSPGLAVYQLQPDGTLKGQWTTIGSSGVGSETLSPHK
jgi:hypothetical protein